jgi:hypothetical protein
MSNVAGPRESYRWNYFNEDSNNNINIMNMCLILSKKRHHITAKSKPNSKLRKEGIFCQVSLTNLGSIINPCNHGELESGGSRPKKTKFPV